MRASWSSSADTISTTRPFCENGTQMKCAETERPCLGEQRVNSFVLSKKKERKEKKNNLEWWLKKKKGQQNHPVPLTFRFSSFLLFPSWKVFIFCLYIHLWCISNGFRFPHGYLLRSGKLFYDEVQCSEWNTTFGINHSSIGGEMTFSIGRQL